jgi:O-antigen biosynthesis protein WbqV
MIDIRDARLQEQLIGRPACEGLNAAERQAYAGRRVLVTGAGGSIGSELVRRLAACGPASLAVVDQSEYALVGLERELQARWPGLDVHPVLGDVSRPRVMRTACEAVRPHVVFHAAAYKHVTTLERDVCAGVQANVLGTLAAVDAARSADARFVLVSSDKAVNPRSVMGATKRLAELLTLARLDGEFRPVIVRFGNVLGSSGSVLELMAECLERGVPIPITHRDATRYFMTVGEAATLVLRADILRFGGEVCWLDMGAPVRIVDLAERLVTLAARRGTPRVPLTYIGLRPGEKLDEELTLREMDLRRTAHDRIWIARHDPVDAPALRRIVRALRADVAQADWLSALADLCAGVPEYRPSEAARRAAGIASMNAAAPGDLPGLLVA